MEKVILIVGLIIAALILTAFVALIVIVYLNTKSDNETNTDGLGQVLLQLSDNQTNLINRQNNIKDDTSALQLFTDEMNARIDSNTSAEKQYFRATAPSAYNTNPLTSTDWLPVNLQAMVNRGIDHPDGIGTPRIQLTENKTYMFLCDLAMWGVQYPDTVEIRLEGSDGSEIIPEEGGWGRVKNNPSESIPKLMTVYSTLDGNPTNVQIAARMIGAGQEANFGSTRYGGVLVIEL